jgi:hypothetical protein
MGADGTVGMTSPLGVVSFWSLQRSAWVDIDGPPTKPGTSSTLLEIAVGPNGLPWVANADHAVFARTLTLEPDVPLPALNTIRAVLMVGGFRTFRELSAMSRTDQRNVLIASLSARTKLPAAYYQAMDDATLGGVGAVLVFIRTARIRTDGEISAMTDDDLRNTLITELATLTGLPVSVLQSRKNIDLVLLGLGSDAAFIRGALLAGGVRTYRELTGMSKQDQRNTLIVELANRTNEAVGHFQALNDPTLGGVGTLLVFMRMARIRTDAEIRTMTDDNLRNTLIVEVAALTGQAVPVIQALKNLDLVQDGLTGSV